MMLEGPFLVSRGRRVRYGNEKRSFRKAFETLEEKGWILCPPGLPKGRRHLVGGGPAPVFFNIGAENDVFV